MAKGIVRFFNASKGYGFIALDEAARTVFVHVSALVARACGSRRQRWACRRRARLPVRLNPTIRLRGICIELEWCRPTIVSLPKFLRDNSASWGDDLEEAISIAFH